MPSFEHKGLRVVIDVDAQADIVTPWLVTLILGMTLSDPHLAQLLTFLL